MPYVILDVFIDVKRRKIIDFTINSNRKADVKCAEQMFKRIKLKNVEILGDGAHDCEWLHALVRRVFLFSRAPVRKSPRKNPSGRYRKICVRLPNFMSQRILVENVFFVLKHTQVNSLRSRKVNMKHRELAWRIIVYNLKRKIEQNGKQEIQSIIFLVWYIFVIPDNTRNT